MKFKKWKFLDVVWVVLILVFLFTPIGFYARVHVMRLFSFSPKIELQETYEKLDAHAWKLVDINGDRYNFSENNDSVVLLNYWATWCPPCIAEMPSLVALHQDYGNKINFVFLANDDKEKVEAYLEKESYTFPVFFEIGNRPEKIDSSSLPTTYIIDKKGNIILKEIGAADWNSKKVRELLDKLLLES